MPLLPLLQRGCEVLWGLLGPWLFLAASASYLPGAALRLVRAGRLRAALSPRALRAAWFGAFWARVGPGVREKAGAVVVPLLEGRVRGGRIRDTPDPAQEPLRGTVLEVGAGTGLWVGLYGQFVDDGLKAADADAAAATATGSDADPQPRQRGARGHDCRVTRVLGVEPNRGHHPELRRRVAEARLGPVYEIVPVGIEDMAAAGAVQKGSVDCIVTTLCLCSIPDPERHIRELYTYLRPGGTWYFFEHVRSYNGWGMVLYQAVVDLFWPHMIGGCHLQRDTGKWLEEAGPWSSMDIAPVADEPWWKITPDIMGTLRK